MAVRTHPKMSVTLDPAAALAARRLAKAQGVSVSAWLSQAALDQARWIEGMNGIAEWESVHGPVGDVEFAAARDELAALGATRRDPARVAAAHAALAAIEEVDDDSVSHRAS